MLNVEKFLHEVGLGVKGQSNLVIAGSPRNSFTGRFRGSDPPSDVCQTLNTSAYISAVSS